MMMAGVSVKTSGTVADILAPVEMLADNRGKQVLSRALNHSLAKTETAVNRALAKQTGLKYGDVKKEISRFSSNAGNLQGEIKGKGGHHKLKEFKARQTKKGVSAAPWGDRMIFRGTFIIGKYGGNVFKRIGKASENTLDKLADYGIKGTGRFPIKALYGPAIPKEMVKDEAQAAFEKTISTALPQRVELELARLFRR